MPRFFPDGVADVYEELFFTPPHPPLPKQLAYLREGKTRVWGWLGLKQPTLVFGQEHDLASLVH